MLVRLPPDPPELHDVHRFHHDWERHASLELRNANSAVIDTYTAHDRIRDGDTDTMLDEVYGAWTADLDAGQSSVMIAQTGTTVAALNVRARADRLTSGEVVGHGAVELHDGTQASVGDLVISRRNNRTLRAGKGWVKNGDRWRITATYPDGSVTVQPAVGRGGSARLPADYVAAHLGLGYAITAHRAQGATVDTAHTVVTPTMTRETLYVAMTRGRHANTAYVTTDRPDDENHLNPGDGQPTGRDMLRGVLHNVGAELSVHDALRTQHDTATSIAQLAAEYETIAAAAQHQRWTALVRRLASPPSRPNRSSRQRHSGRWPRNCG